MIFQAKRQLAGADDISESSVRKLCEETPVMQFMAISKRQSDDNYMGMDQN